MPHGCTINAMIIDQPIHLVNKDHVRNHHFAVMATESNSGQQFSSTAEFIDQLVFQLSECLSRATKRTTSEQTTSNSTASDQSIRPENPFSDLQPSDLAKVRPIMLTLHCLFPNELLLALDILDRRLLRRLATHSVDQESLPTTSTRVDEQDQEVYSSTDRANCRPRNTAASSAALNEERHGPLQHHCEETVFVMSSSSSSSAATFTSARPQPSSSVYHSDYHYHPDHYGSNRYRQPEREKSYEVRLRSWNCTCPTFALSAFRTAPAAFAANHAPAPGESSESEDTTDAPSRSDIEILHNKYVFGGILTCAAARLSPPICKHLLACFLAMRCPALCGEDCRVVSAHELAAWCAGWAG